MFWVQNCRCMQDLPLDSSKLQAWIVCGDICQQIAAVPHEEIRSSTPMTSLSCKQAHTHMKSLQVHMPCIIRCSANQVLRDGECQRIWPASSGDTKVAQAGMRLRIGGPAGSLSTARLQSRACCHYRCRRQGPAHLLIGRKSNRNRWHHLDVVWPKSLHEHHRHKMS